MKLTRQGVRDLNTLPTTPRPNVAALLKAVSCNHSRLTPCCKGACGHLYCPRCGLTWDAHAQV